MQTRLRRIAGTALFLMTGAAPAHADGTFVVGVYPATTAQPAVGVAVGRWARAVGFEIELAQTAGQSTGGSHNASLTFDVLFDTPLVIRHARVYGVAGAGVYGETRGSQGSGEVQAVVLGGGVKIPLRDRLHLRLDYRVVSGATDGGAGFPKTVHAQRFAAGISVGF
jgi:hypothetical protein